MRSHIHLCACTRASDWSPKEIMFGANLGPNSLRNRVSSAIRRTYINVHIIAGLGSSNNGQHFHFRFRVQSISTFDLHQGCSRCRHLFQLDPWKERFSLWEKKPRKDALNADQLARTKTDLWLAKADETQVLSWKLICFPMFYLFFTSSRPTNFVRTLASHDLLWSVSHLQLRELPDTSLLPTIHVNAWVNCAARFFTARQSEIQDIEMFFLFQIYLFWWFFDESFPLLRTFIANSWTRSPAQTACVWPSTKPVDL